MKYYTCDKCGKEAKEQLNLASLPKDWKQIKVIFAQSSSYINHMITKDLCNECSAILMDSFKIPVIEEQPKTPEDKLWDAMLELAEQAVEEVSG